MASQPLTPPLALQSTGIGPTDSGVPSAPFWYVSAATVTSPECDVERVVRRCSPSSAIVSDCG